jgi:hypothetical protein
METTIESPIEETTEPTMETTIESPIEETTEPTPEHMDEGLGEEFVDSHFEKAAIEQESEETNEQSYTLGREERETEDTTADKSMN